VRTKDGELVLAFDTATEAIAIAVGILERNRVSLMLGSLDFAAPRAAMSRLLPAIDGLLDDLRLSPKDLSQVIVGRGPGSFTGVRIGVATAKGLAHGLGVPLSGVGTLDAMAWGAPEAFTGTLGVIGDAMRGEVYPALFDISRVRGRRDVRRRACDYVADPEETALAWAALGIPITLSGNGLAKYEELFTRTVGPMAIVAPQESWAPTGAGLLHAFTAALDAGEATGGSAGELLPLYTRLSDAEEAERARSGPGAAVPPESGVRGPSPPSADSIDPSGGKVAP
jgi:tRNA threonylcarbamoyl adenosine modification protein YeaZ